MRCLSVVLVAVACFLVCEATRSEIIVLYQPAFASIKTTADKKFSNANREYTALNQQAAASKSKLAATFQMLINNLKNEILNAAKAPNISRDALACIKTEETAVSALSTSFLTNVCSPAADNSALITNKARLATISNIASNAVNWCSYLNPFENQNDLFDSCLGNKITDLTRQVSLVDTEYNQLINATLRKQTACIADASTKYLSGVPQIRYNFNMCMTLKKYALL